MSVTDLVSEPLTATQEEQAILDRIDEILDEQLIGPHAKLISPAGETIDIPETLYRLLRQVVHHLAHEDAVSIVPVSKELSTQQAADLLNVSRPYLIQLLESGEISYTRVGTHRRVLFGDLMEFKRKRDLERRQGLRRLTQKSQRLGLYDRESNT